MSDGYDEYTDPSGLLPSFSRSELERIIRERLEEGDEYLARLVFSVRAEAADKRTPEAIVKRFARRHLVRGEYGYIEDSYSFAVDLRRIFGRAEAAAKNGACRFAIELVEKAIEVAAPHAFDGADEEGEIMGAVNEGFERLTLMAQSPDADPGALRELESWALRGVDAAWAREGDSWELTCLELASLAARGEAESQTVLERCSGFTENPRSEWEWTYRAERAAIIAAALLKRKGDEEARRDYIEAHLSLHDIRTLAADEAMAAQDYSRVIELCNGALSSGGEDDRHRSTEAFAERLIEALDALGKKEEAAYEFERLMVRSFSADRFKALKKRYTKLGSWNDALNRVIADLKKRGSSGALASIYEAERMTDRLLALAEKESCIFREYIDVIGKAYPEKAARYLEREVGRALARTSSRGVYAHNAEEILHYGKYAGKEAAQALMESLIAVYPSRRAMKEELERAKKRL
jgi:hypothetical protein